MKLKRPKIPRGRQELLLETVWMTFSSSQSSHDGLLVSSSGARKCWGGLLGAIGNPLAEMEGSRSIGAAYRP